jgi:hypothetical protein
LYSGNRGILIVLANEVGLEHAWPKAIPMITGVYRDDYGSTVTDPEAITQYTSILGVLMHSMNYTRSDVAFAVNYLAKFVNAPMTNHVARVKDVIKYLKVTASYGLHLGGKIESCPLYAHCDSDVAACAATRRSTTGCVVQCGIGSLSWRILLSVHQQTVRRSAAESESIAAGEVAKEIQYLHALAILMLCHIHVDSGM